MKQARKEALLERLKGVNEVFQAIASCGRKFFRYEDRVAWIERDQRGQLFLHNEWNRKRIYISKYCAWRGFHHGGTLHALVGQMVAFIKSGDCIYEGFFSARHWAYSPDDIQAVINTAKRVGFIARPSIEEQG